MHFFYKKDLSWKTKITLELCFDRSSIKWGKMAKWDSGGKLDNGRKQLLSSWVDHGITTYYIIFPSIEQWSLNCSTHAKNSSKMVKKLNNVNLSLRKKCPYSELFWSAFSRIRTEDGGIRTPYSVQMEKKADQNNSEYGHFSRNVLLKVCEWFLFKQSKTTCNILWSWWVLFTFL